MSWVPRNPAGLSARLSSPDPQAAEPPSGPSPWLIGLALAGLAGLSRWALRAAGLADPTPVVLVGLGLAVTAWTGWAWRQSRRAGPRTESACASHRLRGLRFVAASLFLVFTLVAPAAVALAHRQHPFARGLSGVALGVLLLGFGLAGRAGWLTLRAWLQRRHDRHGIGSAGS